MMHSAEWRTELDLNGFVIVPEVLTGSEVERLKALLAEVEQHGVRQRQGQTFAIRDLFRACPAVAELAHHSGVRCLVEAVLGPRAFPVRAILFDKVPEANWSVAWHQDRTIAVKERLDVAGFEGWSEKEGVPHVQPPDDLMARLLTVRLHLDPANAENGALRVIAGSHRHGRLDSSAVRQWLDEVPPVVCEAPAGGALLMRPLLLHASSPSTRPDHRRVVHLDFAAEPLPGGLDWDRAPDRGLSPLP